MTEAQAKQEDNLTPEQRAKKAAKEAQRLEKLAKFEAKQKKLKEAKENAVAKPKVEKVKKEHVRTIDFDESTPIGEKKVFVGEMAASYDPKNVEQKWYGWWEKSGFFKPECHGDIKNTKGVYVIPIPPPNVTGSLHLGHALTLSIQDSLTRWKRMNGYAALYTPGSDHAGIATQAVVEKKLKRERNITRHDLGREAFVKEVWTWKEK
jgi:valyl-tRNA synthetase